MCGFFGIEKGFDRYSQSLISAHCNATDVIISEYCLIHPWGLPLVFCFCEAGLERLVAARMSAAADGWTAAHNNFLPTGENANKSRLRGQNRYFCHSFGYLFLCAGKQVSGGHLFSPWESPFPAERGLMGNFCGLNAFPFCKSVL